MSFLKKHGIWLVSFGALFLIFLHPLLTLRQGFTLGDYDVQFYPWTKLFASEFRLGRFALWTPLVQCGFPLFAEGQTGMLYSLNLFLFSLLPFKAAYNAMFLLHFALGGIFSYAFARKRGVSTLGASIFSLAFTFGSAYAGCFYNIVSMRTLVWFPFLLWLIEHGLGARKNWAWWAYTLILSQSLLGGFLQTAVYGAGFAFIYFWLRFRALDGKAGDACKFFCMNVLALLIASPQIWASLGFASHSTRALASSSEFALWGSAEPWTVVTLFMASWSAFASSRVYIGIVPFLLLFYRPKAAPRDAWFLAMFAVFLALGKYNPLWHLMLELPVMALLRNPSKFLFFTAFFFAFIAAGSLDRLIEDLATGAEHGKRYLRRIAIGCALFLAIAIAATIVVRVFEPAILDWGQAYVEKNILGKSFHRASMEEYLVKLQGMLNVVKGRVDLAYPFFWTPFLLAAFFIVRTAFFGRASRANFKASILLLVCLDLFIYGHFRFGSGFVGNMGRFPDEGIYASLPKDGRYAEWASAAENEAIPANRNMLYGIAHAGVYSPLVDGEYSKLARRLGAIDDSFGREKTDPALFMTDDPLPDALAIKYVLSDKPALHPSYRLAGSVSGHFLFVNTNPHSEAFLKIPDAKNLYPVSPLGKSHDGVTETYVFTALSEGDFVRRIPYDKGWKASLDGFDAPVERAEGAFQSVRIEERGVHRVVFRYEPDWFIIGFWFYACGLLVAGAGLAYSLIRRTS